jgi:pimeloyl-ACP methyl ester carboxylesterase
MAQASPAPEGAVNRMVQTPNGRLHVTDHPGQDPALVLLHGFPDDSRIYDRLAPLLAPRRAVALDWLGYGRSDRVQPSLSGDAQHQHQLRAVLDSLQLDRVVLVGHDASGPDAIDYTLHEPGRVDHLILLNTYYGHAPTLRLPELIRLLADPNLTPLADAMLEDPNLRLWLLGHTARQFGLDPADQGGVAVAAVQPQFFGGADSPDALAAVRAWTAALFPSLDRQDAHIAAGHLAALELPVTLVFGAADPYLNPDLARHLAGLFRHADLHLVEGASHWPQWDQPEPVARLITQATPR